MWPSPHPRAYLKTKIKNKINGDSLHLFMVGVHDMVKKLKVVQFENK